MNDPIQVTRRLRPIDPSLLRRADGATDGRPTEFGLYPEVSRTRLAELLKKDLSTVTYILSGRHACKLSDASEISRLLGVKVEVLIGDLKEQRERWEARAKRRQRAGVSSGNGGNGGRRK